MTGKESVGHMEKFTLSERVALTDAWRTWDAGFHCLMGEVSRLLHAHGEGSRMHPYLREQLEKICQYCGGALEVHAALSRIEDQCTT